MTPNEALDKAVSIIGSMQLVAELCDVTKGAVGQWKLEGRSVPAEHCPKLERATNRAVQCEQLNPDVDWAYLRTQPEGPVESEARPCACPDIQEAHRDLTGPRVPATAKGLEE